MYYREEMHITLDIRCILDTLSRARKVEGVCVSADVIFTTHSAARHRIAIANKRVVRSTSAACIAGVHCLNTTVTVESTE